MLTGLQQLNVELTSRCSKKTVCACCGHQDRKTNPNLKFGDIDFALLEKIRAQVEPGIIISCHRDGDSLDYPQIEEALTLFDGFAISLVTHGERLNERAKYIIGNCTTVTVSIVPKDPDRAIQLESIRGFLAQKGDHAPMCQLKFVGHIENPEEYEALGVPIINRALHSKKGDWNYVRAEPPIPEIRVCLDFLSRPTVDWRGNFYACNRLDPNDDGLLGNLNVSTLDDLWNGPVRAKMMKAHLAGRRDLAGGLCSKCEFYGIPTPAG